MCGHRSRVSLLYIITPIHLPKSRWQISFRDKSALSASIIQPLHDKHPPSSLTFSPRSNPKRLPHTHTHKRFNQFYYDCWMLFQQRGARLPPVLPHAAREKHSHPLRLQSLFHCFILSTNNSCGVKTSSSSPERSPSNTLRLKLFLQTCAAAPQLCVSC